MEAFLIVLVLIIVLCTWGGVKLIKRGARTAADPPIPPARLTSLEGRDAAYAKASTLTRAPRKVGKGVLVGAGAFLIAAPWLALYALVKDIGEGLGGSKGRILRIKNRAQLPELAVGDGWSGDAVTFVTALTPAQRKPLGELWLMTARMEHASVAAFSQLSLHLAALGAPARLLAATHRAALEEIQHAEACFAIVDAITGTANTAGPIIALSSPSTTAIDLPRLAIGSLVDGCLAEGIAADVAARSATTATEPAIRTTLAMIAREEATHAELAWDVLVWCLEQDASLAPILAARIERLTDELVPSLPPIDGLDEATLTAYGVIGQDTLGALASGRIAAVQARARTLVAPLTRALAA